MGEFSHLKYVEQIRFHLPMLYWWVVYHRLGGVPTVRLIVGEENMPFYVHLDVICNESSVFKAAFLEHLEKLLIWHYLWTFQTMTSSPLSEWSMCELAKWSCKDVKTTANRRYWQLAKLNTLADKYNIIGLSNDIIDQLYILRFEGCSPKPDVVNYVYDNMTENSSFRKLPIACYVWDIDTKCYQNAIVRKWLLGVSEMAIDLAIAFGINASDPTQRNPFECDKSTYYHQPKEDLNEGRILIFKRLS